MEEVWVPVTVEPFCKLYSVSNFGRVRSEYREVPHIIGVRKLKARILTPRYTWRYGYPILNLSLNGKMTTFRVHTLVALAFLGPRPPGAEVRHLDGNPRNSHLSNLAYGSSQENANDKTRHGTIARGEKLNRAGLKEADIIAIRADTRLQKDIAEEYGVRDSTISNIKNRVHWKHVE